MDRFERLVDVSRLARRWFLNHVNGTARNGMHDDILLARQLSEVLKLFDDFEPSSDQDRQEWQQRRCQEPVEAQVRR